MTMFGHFRGYMLFIISFFRNYQAGCSKKEMVLKDLKQLKSSKKYTKVIFIML